MPVLPKPRPNLFLEGLESLGGLGKTAAGFLREDDPSMSAFDLAGPLGVASQAAKKVIQATLRVPFRRGMKVIPSSKVVEKMVLQAEGRLDGQRVMREVGEAGRFFTEVDVPMSSVKVDRTLDAARATSSKGPIVLTAEGVVLDGRHRALLASNRGEKTIKALVPIEDPLSP